MKVARLVVLGVAVVAGGIAALLAGRSGDPVPPPPPVAQIETADVLVAKSDIGIGQSVTAQNVQWQTWPATAASAQFIRKGERPGAIEQVSGSIARTPFFSGEPIREAKLIKANGSGYLAAMLPAGMRAISTEISPETGVGGFILPNDRVDVLLTRAEKTTGDEVYSTEIILANVQMLAIDQTVEEKNGQRVVVGKIATLALTPRQTQTLALARRLGTISLSLRSLNDAQKTGSDEDNGDLGRREPITIVRFGKGTTTLK